MGSTSALPSAGGSLLRCDVVNMTRHVHHHFDYKKDGHSRTYTMRVERNESATGLVASTFEKISLLSHTTSDAGSVVLSAGVGSGEMEEGVHR